jgi:hypothetical protein|tara:strand:+ start:335 stop:523 length:189 start_codon:yes stop_codon:yes gene_type:complete
MTVGKLREIINNDWYTEDQEILLEIHFDKPISNGECITLYEVCEENTGEVRLVGKGNNNESK